jgi:osmotically-inducible protein OsmY
MTDQPENNEYGLTSKEARMLGLQQQNSVDTKDVELEASITRKVRSMGGDHIHVSVKMGKVTLSGLADDYETKRSIVHSVESTPGVFKLINNVRVVPGDIGSTGRL